ncbi:PREDICTED: sperm-associated antigen 8-like [Priapulus caudatus]|uniref:Sperm-associated antigen 8-like n=1 Tax=Priapulus caudatus TaxID=37621 RepID=A0ABM1F066_PRICU|nr:PREDICTED: sperm-associated antigen 8-like [Priapulus caudatus]
MSNAVSHNTGIGKTLLGNWVEELSVSHIEGTTPDKDTHKLGHKGIITSDTWTDFVSTCKADYKVPTQLKPRINVAGTKKERLMKAMYEEVRKEVEAKMNQPPLPTEYMSTTQHAHGIPGFQSTIPVPTKGHLLVDEPVTFWSEHTHRIHGLSSFSSTQDTPFKRNAQFSTPITEVYRKPA